MTLVVADAAAVYTLRIADDCLVLSHRLAQWSSCAPTLEDDIALTNIALDLLGQARALYARTAELDGTGRIRGRLRVPPRRARVRQLPRSSSRRTATSRPPSSASCCCSTFQLAQWQALRHHPMRSSRPSQPRRSRRPRITATTPPTGRLRLGDGTDESHRRMEAALATLCPYIARALRERRRDARRRRARHRA